MERKFSWVSHVIESCNNEFHFACADILISLFAAKYGNAEMVSRLKMLREQKWNNINTLAA